MRKRTSTKWRLLRVNHEPCLIDVETLHREADVFLRHRHLKPSFIDVSTPHDIWQPHALHTTLERMRPTSFKNSIPTLLSLKRKVIKSLLATPSSPSVARPYEVAGTEESPMSRSWYRSMVERIFSAITTAAHNTECRERENAKETEPKDGIWKGGVGHDWLTVLVGNYGKITHCT